MKYSDIDNLPFKNVLAFIKNNKHHAFVYFSTFTSIDYIFLFRKCTVYLTLQQQ